MAGNGKFELFRDEVGRWRFHLKDAAGVVLVTSELYPSKEAARDGIMLVKANGQGAPIIQIAVGPVA